GLLAPLPHRDGAGRRTEGNDQQAAGGGIERAEMSRPRTPEPAPHAHHDVVRGGTDRLVDGEQAVELGAPCTRRGRGGGTPARRHCASSSSGGGSPWAM